MSKSALRDEQQDLRKYVSTLRSIFEIAARAAEDDAEVLLVLISALAFVVLTPCRNEEYSVSAHEKCSEFMKLFARCLETFPYTAMAEMMKMEIIHERSQRTILS